MARRKAKTRAPTLTEIVRVRMTEEELGTAKEAASLEGFSLAAYLRNTLLKRATGRSPRIVRRHLVASRIAHWTVGVQQIAVDLDTLVMRPAAAPEVLDAIDALRSEVRALHRAVIAAGDEA